MIGRPTTSLRPSSLTKRRCSSVAMTPSTLTPRMLSISARVTGCRYATIASVSIDAGDMCVFGGKRKRSMSSRQSGLLVSRYPPPTSRSARPLSARDSRSSSMAARMSGASAPVTEHSSFSLTGSDATKRIDSTRLRRVGEATGRSLRRRRERDVVEELRLRIDDLPRADELEHREERHDDLELLAALGELAERDLRPLAHLAQHVVHLDDDRERLALDDGGPRFGIREHARERVGERL